MKHRSYNDCLGALALFINCCGSVEDSVHNTCRLVNQLIDFKAECNFTSLPVKVCKEIGSFCQHIHLYKAYSCESLHWQNLQGCLKENSTKCSELVNKYSVPE